VSKKVIFVIGNPRSGTSLLRIMLHSHPSICIPPECGYVQWWWKKYKNWSVSDNSSSEKRHEYIQDLKSSKKIETWDLDYTQLEELIITEKPANYSELSLLGIQQYGMQQGKSTIYFGDKNNYYIDHLELIDSLYPQSKILHIVRDGRDVACSYLALNKLDSNSPYLPKLANSIKEIAEDWVRNNLIVEDFLADRDLSNNFRVRYEDVILDSEKSLTEICNWLGISYSMEMMKYTETQVEPLATMDWKKKTREMPDSNNIGKYKEVLGPRDIEFFNNTAKEMLQKYAYHD
jgi:hypothetical protein